MSTQIIIYFAILGLFALWWLLRRRIRYWSALLMERGWRSTIAYDRSLRVFNKLYAGVNAYQVSIKERRAKKIEEESVYIYGEVTFYSFIRLLEAADIKPGEVFYDLGSGAGKAVVIADLAFDLKKSCGIEKLDDLYQLSTELLTKLENLPEKKALLPHKQLTISFMQGDFLSVDFLDADVVFINATCFRGALWEKIIDSLHKLKVGARIIVNSQQISRGGFQKKYGNMHLMSWGMCYVTIYQRI